MFAGDMFYTVTNLKVDFHGDGTVVNTHEDENEAREFVTKMQEVLRQLPDEYQNVLSVDIKQGSRLIETFDIAK